MIKISEAKIEDAQTIKNLLRSTWNIIYADAFTPSDLEKIVSVWHSIDLLKQQINDPDVLFLVVRDEDKVVAMVNTNKLEGENLNIQRLHILPEYQRQGIGSKLVKEVIDRYPSAKKLGLEVERGNKQAINFYHKLGFEEAGIKDFDMQGVKMYCMVMEKVI